jgi:hypothetical protein
MGKTNNERLDISVKNIVYQEGKKVFSWQQAEACNSANKKPVSPAKEKPAKKRRDEEHLDICKARAKFTVLFGDQLYIQFYQKVNCKFVNFTFAFLLPGDTVFFTVNRAY